MRVSIYSTPEPKEKELKLKLIQLNGAVSIVAVNEDGERLHSSVLLSIKDDGSLYLPPGINRGLGLQLSLSGCLLTGHADD